MTYDDVLQYCADEHGNVSGYKISKTFGLSMSTPVHWKRWGFVPIKSQMDIEHKTNGVLKADFKHCGRHDVK